MAFRVKRYAVLSYPQKETQGSEAGRWLF